MEAISIKLPEDNGISKGINPDIGTKKETLLL